MPSGQFYHDRRSSTDTSSSDSSPTEPSETPNTTQSNLPPFVTFSPSSSPSQHSPSSPPTSPAPTTNPIPQKTRSNKRKRHLSFSATLHTLSTPLIPFVNSETGLPHPEFPRNHLSFHLLTSAQLDRLARHYHQVWPAVPATESYPFRIRPWVGVPDESCIDIATKRARFGHFIGMAGYTDRANSGTPVPHDFRGSLDGVIFFEPESEDDEGDNDDAGAGAGDYEMSEDGEITVTEEEVLVWMAREWEAALREASDHAYGLSPKF